MRTGYLDKKDANDVSLFDYFGKTSVLRFNHDQVEEVLSTDKVKFIKRLLENSDFFR